MLYASNYILLEASTTGPKAIPTSAIASHIGTLGATFLALVVLFVTLPSWGDIVRKPVRQSDGDPVLLIAAYFTVLASATAHAVAYYSLLRSVGAVTIGVLQALRAVFVFVIGGFLFCSVQKSQCLEAPRVVACITVAAGVIVYGWAKANAHAVDKNVRDRSAHARTGRISIQEGAY
jgi:hypothetical protein